MAEQDRQDILKINKISGLRFREEMHRGYNIINNGKLEGNGTDIKMEQVAQSGPIAAWNKALNNAHENETLADELKKLSEEEYYEKLKKRGVNAEFKKTELDKLAKLAKDDPLKETFYNTRSKRLTK